MSKNLFELKLKGFYLNNPNIKQIEFKKISELDYLYGTQKVSVIIDNKNPNNISGIYKFS